MTLRRTLSILWLFLTLLSIIFVVGSMAVVFGDRGSELEQRFDSVFAFSEALNFWVLGLLVSYLIYLFVARAVPPEKRWLWVVILFFVNLPAMPFFWYWYVWLPAAGDSTPQTETQSKSIVFPAVIGGTLLLTIPTILVFAAYSEGHAYEDIAEVFPVSRDEQINIAATRVSISRPQQHTKTVSLGNVMNVSVGQAGVRFQASLLSRLFYRSFEIPKSHIHSCTKQCGGGTNYLLILEDEGVQIGMETAPELLDWCWSNELPILSSNQRRQWLYSGTRLPPRSDLSASLASRAEYDRKAKRACQGY